VAKAVGKKYSDARRIRTCVTGVIQLKLVQPKFDKVRLSAKCRPPWGFKTHSTRRDKSPQSSNYISLIYTLLNHSNMSAPYRKVLLIGATSGTNEKGRQAANHTQGLVGLLPKGTQKQEPMLSRWVGGKHTSMNWLPSTKEEFRRKSSIFPNWMKFLRLLRRLCQSIQTSNVFFLTGMGFVDLRLIGSGIQRGYNFLKPETIDLKEVDMEVTTNYTSYIHLYITPCHGPI
jgi:hypothetical protein